MTHLRINTPGVIHEAIDGEVVIVNVDRGLYFSSDGVGAKLWTMITNAMSVDSLIEWAEQTYDTPTDVVVEHVQAFVAQLRENELVVPVDEAPEVEPAAPSPDPASYSKPELNVYSDMEELLLLDPVHDATEEGWPHAQAVE
jgi:hypothetical protein